MPNFVYHDILILFVDVILHSVLVICHTMITLTLTELQQNPMPNMQYFLHIKPTMFNSVILAAHIFLCLWQYSELCVVSFTINANIKNRGFEVQIIFSWQHCYYNC